jgi:hypothetical protein
VATPASSSSPTGRAWSRYHDTPNAATIHGKAHTSHSRSGPWQLAGDAGAAAELGSILEFFGAAGGASTQDALANVRKMAPKLRYCLPTACRSNPPGPG